MDIKSKPTPETEYKRPKLTIYGSMVTLTASGSKSGQENNGNTEGTMI